jgi:hypothetical protein
LGLGVGLLVQLVGRVDTGGVVCVSALRKLTMEALRHRKLLVEGRPVMVGNRSIKVPLGVHLGHLFLSSDLCHRLVNWSHVDIRDFHTLIRGDLKLFRNDLRWPFNRQRLLRGVLGVNGPCSMR